MRSTTSDPATYGEALTPIVRRNSLTEAAYYAGSAAAMHTMMLVIGSPKLAVWKDEAAAWARRRDLIVQQEPFPTAATALAETCYTQAYADTYVAPAARS